MIATDYIFGRKLVNAAKSMQLSTTSKVTNWTPGQIINEGVTNTGTKLNWEVSGGYNETQNNIDKPVFNLSTNTGTANMNIYDVSLLTVFLANNMLISSIDVSQCLELDTLRIHQNKLISLDVSGLDKLYRLDAYSMPTITSFTFGNNPALEIFYCMSNTNLANIDISPLTNMWLLQINSTSLTTLNTSSNIGLRSLNCGSNNISSLDLTNNVNLTALTVNNTPISLLNLSANTALTFLNIAVTSITNIDLTMLLSLQTLTANSNNFSGGINLSANTGLKNLTLSACQLTALNLSNNSAITDLQISANSLTTFNPAHVPLVYNCYIQNNLIDVADFTNHLKVFRLWCDGNGMTSLILTNTPNMTVLQCHTNDYVSLDLSGSVNISYLDAKNCTQLTSVNLSANPKISTVWLENSNLPPSATDQVYIDLAAGNVRGGNLRIAGNRTSASDAARATLVSWGWTFDESFIN